MKIASVQMEMHWTLEENIDSICAAIDQAASARADLCLFPELAVTGFHREILKECEAAKLRPEWLARIKDSCSGNKLFAWFGAPTFENGKIYNSYMLISPKGELVSVINKNGLTDSEKLILTSGLDRAISKISGKLISAILCREIVDEKIIQAQLGTCVDLLVWPGFISNVPFIPPGEEQVCHAQAAKIAKRMGSILIQCNWANSLNKPEAKTLGGSVVINKEGKQVFKAPDAKAGISVFSTDQLYCVEWFDL